MRKRRVAAVLASILGLATAARAQFTPAEIARRADWEAFLATAEIVATEAIGEGVTAPLRITLRKDGVEAQAAWKGVLERTTGVLGFRIEDHWAHEIAAYRLDKILGLNMVPVAVERVIHGSSGALSLWAECECSLLEVEESGGKIRAPLPGEPGGEAFENAKYVARLWDSLIANDDRTQQNILLTADWRAILIDHSRSFQSSAAYTKKLVFGEHGLMTMDDGTGGRKPFLFRRVPRALVESIRRLTFESVKAAVAPYLTDAEIKALIARRQLILDEIDEMVRRDGEAKVLY